MKKCGTLNEFDMSKFTVIKNNDIDKYLAKEDAKELKALINRISTSRKCNAKQNNSYLVINVDEPYAQKVADIMKEYGHYN